MAEYANPNVLVSTQWVADHLKDPKVRIVESNEDPLLYDVGHVPGAVKVDWLADLNDQVSRDFVDPQGFAKLASRLGVSPDTTVVGMRRPGMRRPGTTTHGPCRCSQLSRRACRRSSKCSALPRRRTRRRNRRVAV